MNPVEVQQLYFERYVDEALYISSENIKHLAFEAMDKLEGWCTKGKASVLIDLVLLSKPHKIVEIGVFGGKSLIPMAYALQANQIGTIFGIDPWDNQESVRGMDGVNEEWWRNIDHEAILQGLIKKIALFDLEDQVRLIRSSSLDAPLIADIDFLHIDGNHSEEASLIDVKKWTPLVRQGGIIIFDDLNWSGTKSAVEWLNENCINFMDFRGDNIWGIWIKK